MYIPVYYIPESDTPILSKDIARKPFLKVENFSNLKMGHNSQSNWWILPKIELDLHFMIIYLCIKFRCNTPILSKDITWKPFVLRMGRTYIQAAVIPYAPLIENGGGIKTKPIIDGEVVIRQNLSE